MFCTSCGKQIPDDSLFCPECGAKVATAAKVAAGTSGNIVDDYKSNPLKIASTVGAFFIFLAPVLPWVTVSIEFMGIKKSDSINIFQMGGFGVFSGLLLMLIGLFLIAWDVAEYVPAINNIKNMIINVPFVDLITIGVAFILTIIAIIRKNSGAAELEDMLGSDFEDIYNIGIGFGTILCILAIIAVAVPRVLAIVNNKK